MTVTTLAKLLLVDDEPNVLAGLRRNLRGLYDVREATSGEAGLAVLRAEPDIAVVMSDMRMPIMNGTAFLTQARAIAPDAVRLLLTGHADIHDAMGAINDGRIFRFLAKPCSVSVLKPMLADAAEQHRLVTAERELLEKTVRGAVAALCETLALANPAVFGIATRVKRIAAGLARAVGGAELWEVEVAALLCELGAVTVPAHVYERRAHQESAAHRAMLQRVPQVTDSLLAPIPRLEAVREAIRCAREPFSACTPRAAAILRVAMDYEMLESTGMKRELILARLRSNVGAHDPVVLEGMRRLCGGAAEGRAIAVPIAQLLDGMTLAADVFMKSGTMLVARGHEVTRGLVRRLENFSDSLLSTKVLVVTDVDDKPLRRTG